MSLQVGQGNQIINYNYRLDVKSKYLNKLLYNTISAGILYDGTSHGNFQITSSSSVTGNSITINPISFIITPRNRPDILVKVDTTDCFVKTYETDTDTTTTTVTDGSCSESTTSTTVNLNLVARFNWSEENNNVAEFVFTFIPLEHDIILCEIIDDALVFTNQTAARLLLIKPNATYNDSDSLDCYELGNASGNIPISNRTFNTNLNVDTLQLFELDKFAINDGTLQTNLVTESIDGHSLQPQDGTTAPGALNNIPISNGVLQKDLDAQYVNGKDAAYFLSQVHTHNLDEITNNDYSKILNVNALTQKMEYNSITFNRIGTEKLEGLAYDVTDASTYNISSLTGIITLSDVSVLNQSERYIVTDTNNKFYFYEDTTTTLFIAELTNGNYGADQLAIEIETQLEAAGANTYTVVYDDDDNTFDFVNDTGTDFQLLFHPNLSTNGDLESWASATNVNDWTETIAGTSTVNREAVLHHGGTYCARMDIDAIESEASIYQDITLYADDLYELDFWYMTSAAKTAQYFIQDQTTSFYLQAGGTWGAGVYNFPLAPAVAWTEETNLFTPDTDADYRIKFSNLVAVSSSIYFDDIVVNDTINIAELINITVDTGFVTEFSTGQVFGEDFYYYEPEELGVDFATVTGVTNLRMRNPRIFLQKAYDFTDISSTDTTRFALRNAFPYEITTSGFKVKQFPQIIISADASGVGANTYLKVDRDLKEEDFTYHWTVFGEKYIES